MRQAVRVKQEQFLSKLGKRIAELRRGQNLTQEQLADIIDVHRTYVGYIEQGKRNPSIGNLHKLTGALNSSLKELFETF